MVIRLIVPTVNCGLGKPLDAIREYGPTIADIAGGFTATQAIGGWKDESGRLIMEPVTVFDCAIAEPNTNHVLAFRDLAKRIAQELTQDCVYLAFDGEVEFVKP